MRAALLLVCFALPLAVLAQDRQLQLAPTNPAPAGERRIALLIGNSAYKSAPLRNPVNDARAMSRALASKGFHVTVLEDASQATMVRAIRRFGDEIQAGGVALFYYAGHGMQVRGRNYLVPVNAEIEREDEVEFNSVDANLVLAKMDTAKHTVNLMILDACRNNPFARAFRSSAQGLAQMDAPSGTLIAFATAPGSVASDGDGENGLYTKHLLANIGRPGLAIEHVFKEVRRGVAVDTRDRQIPWESSSLRGDFFFVPGTASADTRQQVEKAVAEAVKREQDKAASERAHMEKVIRELLAKQRADLEQELRRTPAGNAAAPVATAAAAAPELKATADPAPPLQTASIAPSASVPSDERAERLPKAGNTWSYQFVNRTTGQRHARYYNVTAVSKEGIAEVGGTAVDKASFVYTPEPQMAFFEAWRFSPYLAAFTDLKVGQKWSSIPVLKWPRGCVEPGSSCAFEGAVEPRERITVPAGTFDALKVVVRLVLTSPIGATNWRYTYWFDEKVKRVVKESGRYVSGPSSGHEYDVELISYLLN